MGQIIVPKGGSRVYLTGPSQVFSQQGSTSLQRVEWPSPLVPAAATMLHCTVQILRIPIRGDGYSDANLIIRLPSDQVSNYKSIGMGNIKFGGNGFLEANGLATFSVPSDPVDPRAFYWLFQGTVMDNGASGGTFGVNWSLCIEGWDLP